MKHNVNDKVIALNSAPHECAQPRTKGIIYTVESVMYCTNCGSQSINIGEKVPHDHTDYVRCGCNNVQANKGLRWTSSIHFAPINNDTLKELEANEEYELCASLLPYLQTI